MMIEQFQISDEMRLGIISKRREFSLSRNALAKILGIENSTLQRWENGQTRIPSNPMKKIILDLINGKLDGKLANTQDRKIQEPDGTNALRRIQEKLKQIAALYMTLDGTSPIRLCILKNLDALLGE